jgi:predicted porin
MKKSLLALAIAGAFSGAAFAQSSVTLFGIADTGFGYFKGDGNGNVKVMQNSALNSSRIGVRGTEDLGGGLKANFWYEAGVATDNGSGAGTSTNNQASGTNSGAAGSQGLTFNRRMFVGLSGGFGEIRLGRNYTPLFMQITSNDPFGTNGSGDTKIYALTGLTGSGVVGTVVRASNQTEYLTPAGIGGVYVHAAYALGENASNVVAPVGPNDGRSLGFRAGWAGGPVDVSVAYNKTDYLQSTTQGNYTGWGVGATLTFGAFKPMFQYVKHKIDIVNTTASDPERTDWLLGLVATFGAVDLRASFNNYNVKNPVAAPAIACPGTTCTFDDAHQIAIGPVYNLSRRTAIYGTVSQMDNKSQGVAFQNGRATTTPGGKTTAVDLGVRHSF